MSVSEQKTQRTLTLNFEYANHYWPVLGEYPIRRDFMCGIFELLAKFFDMAVTSSKSLVSAMLWRQILLFVRLGCKIKRIVKTALTILTLKLQQSGSDGNKKLST